MQTEAWKLDPIASALRGENPSVLARMKSGFATFGYNQFFPGYCVLLGVPKVGSLNDLPYDKRSEFLLDMSLLGDAILAVNNPVRINYAILGNGDHYLHAHLFPRYDWEPEEYKTGTVWSYPKGTLSDSRYAYSEEKHGPMKEKIKQKLLELMKQAY
jgi:diadenosine tetraphosphate (Ap4A) HIT family hydrolase